MYSHSCTQTYISGLKLKVQDQPHPFASYTYAVSPFTEKPVHIDWKIIANDDIESQHIRCHTLQPSDKIKDLISSFNKSLTKAVVLFNTQDNYALAPQLTEGMERGSFPVVILTKSDGQSLLGFFEKFFEQDVLARLDTVSMIYTQPAQVVQQQGEVQQGEGSVTSTKGKGPKTGSEPTGT